MRAANIPAESMTRIIARRLMKDMSVQNHATCLQIDEGHINAKS